MSDFAPSPAGKNWTKQKDALLHAAETAASSGRDYDSFAETLEVFEGAVEQMQACSERELTQLCFELCRLLELKGSAGTAARQDRIELALATFEMQQGLAVRTSFFQKLGAFLLGRERDTFVRARRLQIARQILKMTLRPQDISQGIYATCNVTVIQNRMFSVTPSRAARIIVDAVVARNVLTFDGSSVLMTERMLHPDEQAQAPEENGKRNLASMVFQRVAINTHWQRTSLTPDEKRVQAGCLVYHQLSRQIGERTERVINLANDPPTECTDRAGNLCTGGLNLKQIVEVYGQLNNGIVPKILILNGSWAYSLPATTPMLGSVGELHTALRRVLNANDFPVFAYVPRPPGAHIYVVRDYDPDNGTVSVDDSWDASHDFLGTEIGSQPRKAVSELYKELAGVK